MMAKKQIISRKCLKNVGLDKINRKKTLAKLLTIHYSCLCQMYTKLKTRLGG